MNASWFQRPRVVAGLDVGSRFAKLVEVDHGGDQPEVVRVDVRALPRGGVADGVVADLASVAGALQGLARGAGKRCDVVGAVGGHDVFIKTIEVGATKPSEIREAVLWEAERRIPLDIRAVQVDHHVLRLLPGGRGAAVLLVAAKRELVESRIGLLAEAGASAARLDVEALALHNAFRHNYPGAQEGIVALANIGHQVTNVNVVEDGTPAAVLTLPWGSRSIEAAVERECNVPEEQAERVVRGQAGSAVADRRTQEVAEHVVASGIKRATASLAARGALEGLGRIFLSGGGALVPGLAEGVAQHLRTETSVVNPFERVPVRPSAAGASWLSEVPAMLMLPLGLALRAT